MKDGIVMDGAEQEYLLEIIKDQLHRHPGFQVDDLYKMVHQVTFGGAHLLKNKEKARKMLLEEWENTERIPKGETLLEVIDPSGEIIRVNLRVYKKVGGTVNRLFDLFVQSTQGFKQDRDRLVNYWEIITEEAMKGVLPFSKDTLEDFWIEVGRKGFPAVHHSESYIDTNRPAYRLVIKSLWEGFRESNG